MQNFFFNFLAGLQKVIPEKWCFGISHIFRGGGGGGAKCLFCDGAYFWYLELVCTIIIILSAFNIIRVCGHIIQGKIFEKNIKKQNKMDSDRTPLPSMDRVHKNSVFFLSPFKQMMTDINIFGVISQNRPLDPPPPPPLKMCKTPKHHFSGVTSCDPARKLKKIFCTFFSLTFFFNTGVFFNFSFFFRTKKFQYNFT